jgi:hypothetical protein
VMLLVLMQTGGKDGQDLSINNLFRRIYIKVVYERGPEFSGPLYFYAILLLLREKLMIKAFWFFEWIVFPIRVVRHKHAEP